MKVKPALVLQSINGIFKNKKLYPPGHPSFASLTKKTHNLLSIYLEDKQNAFFGIINDTFVFDDFPILDAEKLYHELHSHIVSKKVEAISFKKGFTQQELNDALDILSDERGFIAEEVQKLFRIRSIRHITIKIGKDGDQNSLEIYNGAIRAIKNVMSEVRMGKIPDSTEINDIVSDMTDSVLNDPNAMLGLTMIKEYDDYLYTHCINVGLLSIAIGKTMGLDVQDLHRVGLGGLLHDIGKTAVSEDIIKKKGGLDEEEWNKLKTHPVMGSNIVKRMVGIDDIVMHIIYEHHVRYDHTGYPVTDEKLHKLTPIATIADAYDAITTLRVYQKPCLPLEAVKILQKLSGKHFEPETLKAFIKTLGVYPVGTTVKLSTGEIGVVIKAVMEAGDKGSVKVIYTAQGKMRIPPTEVELAGDDNENGPTIIEPVSTEYDLSDFFEQEAKAS